MTEEEKGCTLCPRNCRAKRYPDHGNGYCRMGTLPMISRAAPHMWEEPCISGTKGSGTIFFTGCVLSCVFCQNYCISTENKGRVITVDELVDHVKRLEQIGVHNINLVSPTPYIDCIVDCFTRYRPSVPVVYNTGGYEKAESLKKLKTYYHTEPFDVVFFESNLSDVKDATVLVMKDGKIITSRGAGTAISFALRIIHALEGEDVSDEIKKSIVYMD